ncbi:nucleotide exchange factor GrpE [Chloroflexota bacterium]
MRDEAGKEQPQPEAEELTDDQCPEEGPDAEKENAEQYLANWQRAQADFVNYKRRAEQEKEELGRYANAELLKSLLPVIDDLGRAAGTIPPKLASSPWVAGIRMIAEKLSASLGAAGVQRIATVGEPFDPNFHEAVRQESGSEGIVIEEMSPGYMLHDRLLRAATVVVGNGEGEEKEDATNG